MLFVDRPPHSFAVAAHSYSEAYSILTRKSQSSLFCWPASDAIAALESVAAKCVLVGLTHAQTFDAIKTFAAEGGIGPRLYDQLIGEAAMLNGLNCIVTWNGAHMLRSSRTSGCSIRWSFANPKRALRDIDLRTKKH